MRNSSRSRSHIGRMTADPLDTSVGLLLGYFGAMVAATTALATSTTTAEWQWFAVFATNTAVTSRKTATLWAAYNGLVGGFFYNFIRPPSRRLAFDSVPSVIFEAGFIAIALTGSYAWRWWRARSVPVAPATVAPRRSVPTLHLTPRQREKAREIWPNRQDTD